MLKNMDCYSKKSLEKHKLQSCKSRVALRIVNRQLSQLPFTSEASKFGAIGLVSCVVRGRVIQLLSSQRCFGHRILESISQDNAHPPPHPPYPTPAHCHHHTRTPFKELQDLGTFPGQGDPLRAKVFTFRI